MSFDRRIVSILYFNNINDVSRVEKYIGENGDYYEVVIDGKVQKLKIPGRIYNEIEPEEFFDEKILKDFSEEVKKVLSTEELNANVIIETSMKPLNEENSEIWVGDVRLDRTLKQVKDSFEESIEESKIESEKILESFPKSIESAIESANNNNDFVTTKVVRKTKVENENKEQKKPRSPKISNKKIEIVESKKLNDDINNFIDLA